MKENKEYLHERIKHFQSLIDYMSERGQRYYLEKDWFDNPTLISIEKSKKEVELAQKKLELLPRRSVMGCVLQLLHRFIFEKGGTHRWKAFLKVWNKKKITLKKS